MQAIDWITQHLTLDRALVEITEPLRRQLLFEKRVILRFISENRDIRGIPFVAGARVRQVLQLNFHRQLSK
jgi:hypothetical protein